MSKLYIPINTAVLREKRKSQIPIPEADLRSTVHSEALHLTRTPNTRQACRHILPPIKHRVTQQRLVHKSAKVSRFLGRVKVTI